MHSFTATWSFAPTRQADSRGREPVVLSTLHALQSWRQGHAGRAFRFVRASPFVSEGGLRARLVHLPRDLRADGELVECCEQHMVDAFAAQQQQAGTGTPAGTRDDLSQP